MTTITPLSPLSTPSKPRKRAAIPAEFPSELSALYPSSYTFSWQRFHRQMWMNLAWGVGLGFVAMAILVPLFPNAVLPLASRICDGTTSIALARPHFEAGVFGAEPRILCTSASGVAEVFTMQSAWITFGVAAAVFFALAFLVSVFTRKFFVAEYR